MTKRLKKAIYILLACLTVLPLITIPISTKVSADNNVVINLSEENQEIRGFGGMNHSVWIGDLTPDQRETAFGNGENQLGFSILRIPIDETRSNWQREVDTAKAAIDHGAIVFAAPWNPPNEMVERVDIGMRQGSGTIYEAETNTILTEAIVENLYSDYTGSGYVNFEADSGASVQWNNIIIGIEGTKDIRIRYALESGTRYLDVYLNDQKVVSDLAFEATGSWSTWADKSIQIPMSIGNNNVLKLVTTGTEGPNIDHINLAAYNVIDSGKRLRHDMYDEYAAYLNEFDSFMRANGVDLHAISIQNEPDYAYDWTWWTPEEMLRFMKENAGSINTRVIAPESFSYVKQMSDPILNDPEALANLDILGAHLYGTHVNDFSYPLFKEKGAGKELWMTEVYYPNSDMTSGDKWPEALDVAEHIHHALADGDFQAYVWWYIRRGYSPMKEDGTISKRGYSMAHYSKFIRPGYVRVEATKNPEPEIYTSAYKGDDKVVIVAVNKGTTEATKSFDIQNGNISQVSSWVTDGNRSMDSEPDMNAVNNSFTAQLPPQSVTTFVSELEEYVETEVLEELLVKANSINKNDYTEDTFESLQELIDEAEVVLAKSEVTQEEIDRATAALLEAMENLKKLIPALDIGELESLLEKATEIKKDDYTKESFDSLQQSIIEAEKVLANPEVTQDEVNAAVILLQEAMKSLKESNLVLDTAELENILAKAKGINEDEYTQESFHELKEAIVEAENLLERKDLSQEDIHKAVENLQNALESLKKIESPPVEDSKKPVTTKDEDKIDKQQKNEGKYLPKTATNNILFLLLGSILFSLGAVAILYLNRKRIFR